MHPTRVTSPSYFVLSAEFHDNVPFVWGMLDGVSRRFLFDSGGQELMLNKRHLPTSGLAEGSGIIGATGMAPTQYTTISNLAFGEWQFENHQAMVMDMQHLEEELGVELHGIIGFRQMLHFDWMVDYAAGEIHMWQRIVKSELNIQAKVPTRYSHHLPMIDLEIAGHTFRFLVDTGASMVLLDARKRDLVIAEVSDCVSEGMASASATKVTVESGTLSGFTVASLPFGPSNIKFADLSGLQAQIGDFDGVIGYPLLSQYRVIVSWSFHVMYILAK